MTISVRRAVADDAQEIRAVFDASVREGCRARTKSQSAGGLEAAGHRRDGSVRESDFRGVHLREPRLVKSLEAGSQ